ncbi:20084_t:CDS:2 [Entrophospora sp. SA101]|nr:20084_t:CDS:2 [Entrophospora sp. SA101]
MVILNETRFFITVVQGCEGSLYQPGYICEVNGAFTKDHLDNTGPGFKSSFVYLIGAKKIKTYLFKKLMRRTPV